MRDLDIPCKDIRTREVGMKQIQEAVSPDDVELIRRDYVANGGWETFLSYEDPEKDILIGENMRLFVYLWYFLLSINYDANVYPFLTTAGLLRLRKASAVAFRPEISEVPSSIVR